MGEDTKKQAAVAADDQWPTPGMSSHALPQCAGQCMGGDDGVVQGQHPRCVVAAAPADDGDRVTQIDINAVNQASPAQGARGPCFASVVA